ncbi:MAG TPA: hypothetical protein VLB00_05880 [Gemmatimonadales bacterium]|nr:hypothetical protein [Gemmatimonadales bacterium]
MTGMLRVPGKLFVCWLLLSPVSAGAQSATTAPTGFSERLGYLLAQASSGFALLRGDSIGVDSWRGRFLLTSDLDSVTAFSASSVSVLARQHADGRPGKAIVAVFPLALPGPQADSVSFSRLEEQVSAVLPAWQKRQPGNWSECADPRRGREVLLFRTRTASGAALLSLSITLHPDTACD